MLGLDLLDLFLQLLVFSESFLLSLRLLLDLILKVFDLLLELFVQSLFGLLFNLLFMVIDLVYDCFVFLSPILPLDLSLDSQASVWPDEAILLEFVN